MLLRYYLRRIGCSPLNPGGYRDFSKVLTVITCFRWLSTKRIPMPYQAADSQADAQFVGNALTQTAPLQPL